MLTSSENFQTLMDVLQDRSIRTPDKIVYRYLGDGKNVTDTISYAELERKVKALACFLWSQLNPGDRVILSYPTGLDFIIAFYACLQAKVVAVPIMPAIRNTDIARLHSSANNCSAKLILSTKDIINKLELSNELEAKQSLTELSWFSSDQDFESEQSVSLPAISPDTLAMIQYTSGSLAAPKGVMVTHANLIENAKAIQQGFQDNPDSIGVSWLPFYHDMGLMGGIIQPLYVNATMSFMSPLLFLQKPLRWLQAISKVKATTSGAPNFAYELCVQKIKKEDLLELDLSHWKVAFIGAEPIDVETLSSFTQKFSKAGFADSAFYPCYGMSETTLLASGGDRQTRFKSCQIDPEALKKHQIHLLKDEKTFVSNGRVREEHEIVIVNPKTQTQCSDNEVGEIWFRGPCVAKGYWNDDSMTEMTFHAKLSQQQDDHFLRTGDLGFMIEGELYISGRLKEMLIIRGRNHYPQDIEATVKKCHPGFSLHCAAFIIEHKEQQQLIIVQEVERSFTRKIEGAKIIPEIRRAVVDEHGLQVHQVILVKFGSIPKTSSGKVKRQACQEKYLNNELKIIG